MLKFATIIGSSTEGALEHKLHELSHNGSIDFIIVQPDDLERRRLMARTEAGEDVAISLPRDQRLFDGAVLYLDEKRAVIVKSGEQRWLRLSPRTAADALELGYVAGNLHWRVRFEDSDLIIAQDAPFEDYLARLQYLLSSGRVEAKENPR